MKKPSIILLGAPGSGKGTRAVALCEVLGIPQISTGDLFRKNLKEMTEIGKIAKGFLDKGELVPDDVTISMLKERLEQNDIANGFILDGFPRTIMQAQDLENLFKNDSLRNINCVIYIDISDEEVMRRLSGRMICSKCQAPYHITQKKPKIENICDLCGGNLTMRDDDKPETIRHRLQVYHEQTFPLVEFYTKRNLLIKIPSEISEKGIVEDMKVLCKKLDFIA